MWSDASFGALVSDALIDQALHPFDELGRGEPAAGLDSAADAMTEYQATADYAKAQDKGQPESARIQAAE